MKKKRSIIMLDELPPVFKRKKIKVDDKRIINVPNTTMTCDDKSGTLICTSNKWRSVWYYKNYHVRVTCSTNPDIKEGTVFVSSTHAAIALHCGGYHNIHKAIINDTEISGCYLEYTITKN